MTGHSDMDLDEIQYRKSKEGTMNGTCNKPDTSLCPGECSILNKDGEQIAFCIHDSDRPIEADSYDGENPYPEVM